jgi:hypothetical protein
MSLAGQGAAAAFSIWSGYQTASLIQEQGRLNQRIAEMNARFAELDAIEAEKYGYSESARYQSVIDTTVGEQVVAFANQNVDATDGTAAELIRETKTIGFLNQLQIQEDAIAKARGIRTQASNYRFDGNMQRLDSKVRSNTAVLTGYTNAIGAMARG